MKRNKIITLATTLSFLMSGCGGGGGGGGTPSTTGTTATTIQVVRGPLLHATVKDNANQTGTEQGNGYYKFSNTITYPLTASGGIIDVNRDGKVSAGDIKNTMVLKTKQGTVVTVATTYDANDTTKTLVDQTLRDLNISRNDLYKKTPINSKGIEAISNILYKHAQDNNVTTAVFDTIKTEIKNEFKTYNNNSSHDSKKVEQKLMQELATTNKVHELTQPEAANENTTFSNSQNNNANESSGGNEGSEGSEGSEGGTSNDNTTTGSTNTTYNTPNATSAYTLLAWNDLGMHCMDGSDFSVFSILPPYNNLNAQLIKRNGTTNKHVTSGVTITYTAAPSLTGKYNTTSMLDSSNNPKTNFWDYVGKLFNKSLTNDIGLTGNATPSLQAQKLTYNATHNWWEATALPLTPYNDDGSKNYYPMVNVTAKDASGNTLATTKVVLPISDEMDCKACHSSKSGYTSAKPTSGWENDSNTEKDFKFNILKLHDQKFPKAVSDNQIALKDAGYTGYNVAGLYQSAKDGNPTLCATCHASNALPGTGIKGIKPLTEALHTLHANVLDPTNGIKLGDSTNRSACYRCHPGATTQCLRGAMGKKSNIQCQSCHGDMNAVGKHGRVGWLDEPNCQACHQNGQRYTTAVTNTRAGTLRASLDKTFATNASTPKAGVSMYRFSTGHGKMQCSACHGSTHAIYPSSHKEDNLQSIAVQGHTGTIAECTACHTTMPNTIAGGPHGMHSVGQAWISNHQHASKIGCTSCHGSNSRGTVLSKTFSARTFSTEHGTKTYTAGQQVTCFDCHNGPNGGE